MSHSSQRRVYRKNIRNNSCDADFGKGNIPVPKKTRVSQGINVLLYNKLSNKLIQTVCSQNKRYRNEVLFPKVVELPNFKGHLKPPPHCTELLKHGIEKEKQKNLHFSFSVIIWLLYSLHHTMHIAAILYKATSWKLHSSRPRHIEGAAKKIACYKRVAALL